MLENGWQVHRFPDPSLLEEARDIISSKINGSIEAFHLCCPSDILPFQYELSNELVGKQIIRRIIESDKAFFFNLIGLDLHIQKFPYLRIARPRRPEDNIGMHRDTWYGSSPYELNVSIALTATDEQSALRIVPGSHDKPESFYPTASRAGGHQKHSIGHKLGFLYAPKKLIERVPDIAIPLKIGEALIFGPSLIHGQEINNSESTRFSVDVRLVDSFAPIQWKRTAQPDYYEPFSTRSSSCSPSL